MAEAAGGEILLAAARQVLETMFFTSIVGERPGPPDGPVVAARVSFEGDPSGSFGLKLSAGAARAIAANFLGVENDEEVTAAQTGEVICELANMVCGAILSRVESGSTFQIAHPQLAAGEEACDGATARYLDLDNGALALWVRFDGK
ncbi:MAG: chemotaxis protein CheX [Rhodospirillales bacterium]